MPSDCKNYLFIVGPLNSIKNFVNNIRTEDKHVNFDKLVPMPVDVTTEWAIENWGTKWEPYQELEWSINDHGNSSVANTFFLTAWSPPVAFVKTVSELYPDLLFTLEYGSLAGKYIGNKSFCNGELMQSYEPLWNSSYGRELRKQLDLFYE